MKISFFLGSAAIQKTSIWAGSHFFAEKKPIRNRMGFSIYKFKNYILLRFLSFSSKYIFLKRIDFGVTSTYSSFWIYSNASSKENFLAGIILALSSAPDERTL